MGKVMNTPVPFFTHQIGEDKHKTFLKVLSGTESVKKHRFYLWSIN
jgi:hypothetical protein